MIATVSPAEEEAARLKVRLRTRLRHLAITEANTRPRPDPVTFTRTAGLDPDDWQEQVMCSTAPRLLLNCARQSGKSTIIAALATYTALYQAPALVLLLSPGLRQSIELFRKVLDVYHGAGNPVVADAESVLRLELTNGSRIIALPGKEGTIRGYSGVSLLVMDEASRIDDGLYYATRPMLAVSGGRLVLLSTPYGRRGIFYQEWTEGIDWERVEITAENCPRISAEFLAAERASLPDWIYRQEYEAAFVETDEAVFRYEDIMNALDNTIPPLFTAPLVADGAV